MDNCNPALGQDHFAACIALGRGEEVRITISPFKGKNYLSVRKWYLDADNEMKPSKSGVTVRVDLLPDIVDGVNRALDEARRGGLV